MPKHPGQWTLENLIDFEHEVAGEGEAAPEVRQAVVSAGAGLDGLDARRVGFRVWLDQTRTTSEGAKFLSALGMVGALLAVLAFLAGAGAVTGMVDRGKSGIHVGLFVAILIGGQWLVMVMAALGWSMRRRGVAGLGAVQAAVGKLAKRLTGQADAAWWGRIVSEGGAAREAMLWRIARTTQAAAIWFNLGIVLGLLGMVLVKRIGFYWETTTELAMQSLLEKWVAVLSWPWASWWPAAVPDAAVIRASEWMPGQPLAPGPAAWWQFLFMATLVWGLLPRVALWFLACRAGHRALGRLEFQSRLHRAKWRELSAAVRTETDDRPLDGVLVLDVGGSRLGVEAMRPFLLRKLRVNPAAWHPVAVLDSGAEAEAARALAGAPAGVVLLAEGWSLSPPRMTSLHQKIRKAAGAGTPVKFLVANRTPEDQPATPTAEEKREWERFVDALRDPEAEVFFYEALQPAE